MPGPRNSLQLQLQLMFREAETRLGDGALLDANLGSLSDSGCMLRLLGFELLLKACVKAQEEPFRRNHSYVELWNLLPEDVRGELQGAAQLRMSGVADYSDLPTLLETWSRNFVALRYPYEKYEDLKEAEYHARGEEWIASGARDADADFVY